MVLLCVMWVIWRECNKRVIKDLKHSGDQLIALFVGTLFDWSRAWGLTSSDSIPMFINTISPVHHLFFFLFVHISFGYFILLHEVVLSFQ